MCLFSISDFNYADGSVLTPQEIHSYLGRIMYQRRSKVNPLWNQVLVGGYKDGESFLGTVDIYGSIYTDNVFSTGFGQHLAIPLLRKGWRPNLTFEEGKALLEKCMEVLFYRDCRALNSVSDGDKQQAYLLVLIERLFIDIVASFRVFSFSQFQLATITASGSTISEPYSLPTYWEHTRFVYPDWSGKGQPTHSGKVPELQRLHQFASTTQ